MASDDPAFLAVGTAVSAKYKGAFCESIVKKIDKNVKCKVTFKDDNKSAVVLDEDIKGLLKVGSAVEARRGDIFLEAVINRVTDHSIYHVLFDDGDENSLKRSKLCPKGDKHFTKGTTLDGLPLTHPEHFWSPVIKGNSATKKNSITPNPCSESEDSNDSDVNKFDDEIVDSNNEDLMADRRQDLVGRLVYTTHGDSVTRKNQSTNQTNAVTLLLVVLPGSDGNAPLSGSKILTKSFKDSRFHSQSLNNLKCLSQEDLIKMKDTFPKLAYDRALAYLSKNELPSSWDRSDILGYSTDDEDDDDDDDADSNDDNDDKKKSSELSDRFVAELYRFMEERGSPINRVPTISNLQLDLYKLFHIVQRLGGNNKVTNQNKWHIVHRKMNFNYAITRPSEIKAAYKKYLHAFEDLDRKLGRFTSWSSKMSVGSRSIIPFRDRDHELYASTGKINRFKKRKDELDKTEIDMIKDSKENENDEKVKLNFKYNLSEKDYDDDDGASSSEEQKNQQRQRLKSSTSIDAKFLIKVEETNLESSRYLKKEQQQMKSVRSKDKMDNKNIVNKVCEKQGSTSQSTQENKKNRKIVGIVKSIKDAAPIHLDQNLQLQKSEKKDGRFKENKLIDKKFSRINKGDGSRTRIEVGLESISSTGEGEEGGKDEVTGKRKGEISTPRTPVICIEKNGRSTRRILRRDTNNDNSNENKEEIQKSIYGIIYPIGTRLKVKYGDGKNTKIYGAKILEMKERDGCQIYLVHYNGWNSRYDDWISPDQIVEVLADGEDQIVSLPPRSARSINIIKGHTRMNRYHRLSSSDTNSCKGDNDKKAIKKKRFGSSECSSDSDKDSINGSDLNSEKSESMKGKLMTSASSSSGGGGGSHSTQTDATIMDNNVANLLVASNVMMAADMSKDDDVDVDIVDAGSKPASGRFPSGLDGGGGSDSNVSGESDPKLTATKEINNFDKSIFNAQNIGLEFHFDGQHSPTFPGKLFQKNSAFTRKLNSNKASQLTTRINENRSVWKDDGQLNLNLTESPVKSSPNSYSHSPVFDAFAGGKPEDEYKFIEGDDKGDDDFCDGGGGADKNSPLETGSSEGGGVEENTSTKSDREANREVEAYMTSDYTILDRKADYVMLNRLPGRNGHSALIPLLCVHG